MIIIVPVHDVTSFGLMSHEKTGFLPIQKQKAHINCTADQSLYFCYMDSTISLLLKPNISSVLLFCVTVQAALCWTWLETPKTGFLVSRLKLSFEFLAACREQ